MINRSIGLVTILAGFLVFETFKKKVDCEIMKLKIPRAKFIDLHKPHLMCFTCSCSLTVVAGANALVSGTKNSSLACAASICIMLLALYNCENRIKSYNQQSLKL